MMLKNFSRFAEGLGPVGRFFGRTCIVMASCGLSLLLFSVAQGHEHEHTHFKLTQAAFRLLDSDFFRDPARSGGMTSEQIEAEMAQGVIDEDECIQYDGTGGLNANGQMRDWGKYPNWNSHFYEAKRGIPLDIAARLRIGVGCFTLPDSEFSTAAARAQRLWALAVEDYRDGKSLSGQGKTEQSLREYRSAYRILGRVLHLLEDMTSPAHVHDSPHGEIISNCGGDSDDFERWGWCAQEGNSFILDYFKEDQPLVPCVVDINSDGTEESFGIPPQGFTCRLWASLQRLYAGKPQGAAGSADPVVPRVGEALPFAYLRHVANVTYDFTTFAVHLKDDSPRTDAQPSSELKSMLRGSGPADCGFGVTDNGLCDVAGGWWIGGPRQQIGKTEGKCGSVERAVGDWREEWYVMETGCIRRTPASVFGGLDIFVDGFAFVENIGGEGALGLRNDSFVPLRYGCTTADDDRKLCRDDLPLGPRSKVLYQMLYGTVLNGEDPFEPEQGKGKTALRIFGDVLYPTAVAYGAGLIQAFIDEASEPPVADSGGPYEQEACQIVTLDGSGSSDPNGSIVSYEWDFTDDGVFDVLTDQATYEHAYADVFIGQARLRVTDDEHFTGQDSADVMITPDVTSPVLREIRSEPPHLWPPNHKLVPVTVMVKTDDACDTAPVCRITKVTSNQPVSSQNDHTSPDWIITGDLTVDLRAERVNEVPSGNGAGKGASQGIESREYDVSVICTDGAGNSADGHLIIGANQSTVDNSQAQEGRPVAEPFADAETSAAVAASASKSLDQGDGAGGSAIDPLSLLLLLLPLARGKNSGK